MGRNGVWVNDTADMQTYSSIEELAAASDLVVAGAVQGIVAREVDYGAAIVNEQGGRAAPIVFYGVAVTETLRGDTRSIIIVGAPDPDDTSIDRAMALASGQQILLFLKMKTEEDAPEIKSYQTFFVPLGLSNGVFDLLEAGLVAEPRLPDTFDAAQYRMSEVRAKVRR